MIKPVKDFKNIFIMMLVLCAILLLLLWIHVDSSSDRLKKLPVRNKICYVNLDDERPYFNSSNNTDLTMIYFITPTYPRPEQAPELTRLSHTLMHVPRIHWIVADDQPRCSNLVLNILRKSRLPFTYISSPRPYLFKSKHFPRGVANRRAALAWLHNNGHEGVVYFGDDDNTVDLELFDEIRKTKKVSMFPVGLIGKYGVSAPVIRNGKVAGFFDSWPGLRKFPVDMAGFAINIEFLKPNAIMPYTEGQEENKFLVNLGLNIEDIEPLASNCSKILVWHTQTTKNKTPDLKIDVESLQGWEHFVDLLKEVSNMGMAHVDPQHGDEVSIIRDCKTYKNFLDLD